MARLQVLVPWVLMLVGLLPSLVWAALVSLAAFLMRDGPAAPDPEVVSPLQLLVSAALVTPPAVCFAAVAASWGLRSGARWAPTLALSVAILLLVGSVVGATMSYGFGGLFALSGQVAVHFLGPGLLGELAVGQGVLAIVILVGLVPALRGSRPAASRSYSPRRIERWAAALMAAFAVEHAVLAVVVLLRGVTGSEGAIVLSAPVFVIAGLGLGLGVLRERAWARPALVVASVPVAFWTLYIGGVFAYFLSENVYRVETGGVLVAMFVVAILIAAFALRRSGVRVS